MEILPIKNRGEFRRWLSENHGKEKECWIIVQRGRPVDDGTFWYIAAVEEALCFGWIDCTTKKTGLGTAQRFAPRRKKKRMVRTEQRALPQNGKTRQDDRRGQSRSFRYV